MEEGVKATTRASSPGLIYILERTFLIAIYLELLLEKQTEIGQRLLKVPALEAGTDFASVQKLKGGRIMITRGQMILIQISLAVT